MTQTPHLPSLLPLIPTGPHGSRSRMTCHYRCGDACDQPIPNQTGHPHVRDEINRALARRTLLQGAALGGTATLVGTLVGGAGPAAAAPAAAAPLLRDLGRTDFAPVAPNKRDALVVPDGFRHDVVIRWGDAVERGAPPFDVNAQTPEAASEQFGYNCDYVCLLELENERNRALLVVNHEFTNEVLMFPAGAYDDATIKRIAMASHGMSVVKVKRGTSPGSWLRVSPQSSRQNRRITASTPFRVVGPAAGNERLKTSADPSGRRVLGTLNNCAGGKTPWGTVLSGEENFNQYFDASGELDARYTASYARYGLTGTGSRGWSEVDPRFDLTTEPHEPFRFGWIVELDPLQPDSAPRKHTMLGRFKHEGANITVTKNGTVIAYMGDDERGDYLYKFVARDKFRKGKGQRERNKTLLDARHPLRRPADRRGAGRPSTTARAEWIPLTSDKTSFVDGMSVADVLIDTRLAADMVSADPDGPARGRRAEPGQRQGVRRAHQQLLRGTTFPVDEPNPLASSMTRPALGAPLVSQSGNRNGYVLEFTRARRQPRSRPVLLEPDAGVR